MKSKLIYIILCLNLILCAISVHAQEDNPFLKMADMEYGEYHDEFWTKYDILFFEGTSTHEMLLQWIAEVAEIEAGENWKYNWKLANIHMKSYKSRNGGFVFSPEYTAEDVAADFFRLYEDAKTKGITHVELQAFFHGAEMYRIFLQNYGKAFEYYIELAEMLENISTKDFPHRPYIYDAVASLYYGFGDYENAIVYFTKIINDPYVPDNFYKKLPSAYNGLGLCYRDGYANYEESDKCFQLIKQNCGADKWIWEGIANGNLGNNQVMQGNYDAALPLLISSIEQITNDNDNLYVSGKANSIADIYLMKGDLHLVKKYIDIAVDYRKRSGVPQQSARLYAVQSKYYSIMHEHELAIAYFDSTILANKKEHDDYNGHILRRIDQRLYQANQQILEKELHSEQIRSRAYLWISLLAFAILFTTAIFLFIIIRLYRKKAAAYNELASKAEKWAAEDNTNSATKQEKAEINTTDKHKPTKEEKELFDKIRHAMIHDKIFTDSMLSLESLAQSMATNVKTLSKTINNAAGVNFNNYVNEYRIKEAVRILSSSQKSNIYIENLFTQVGFASRTPFYAAFKKITGLSPSEFKSAKRRAEN